MPTGVITAFAESTNTIGDCTWVYNDTTCTLTISGNGILPDMTYSERPWHSVEGSIKSVVVEEGVTQIGSQAFYKCFNLNSVILPSTVTKIGYEAFRECHSLENINLPDEVTYIGENAFYECKELTLSAFPSKLKTLGSGAFFNCIKLVIPDIPDSVTYVSSGTFQGTKTVNDFKNSGDSALYNGSWLIFVKSDYQGVLDIKSGTKNLAESVFNYREISEVIIPEGITELGSRAFNHCNNLEKITMPDTLKTIGSYCFDGCKKLENIDLPDGLTEIGIYAFYGTGYRNNADNWEDGILYNGAYLLDGSMIVSGDIVVKNGTKLIADCAFQYTMPFTSITLPDGLVTIGNSAFYARWGSTVKTLHIPESVKYIGNNAFLRNAFENINIPKKIEYIGEAAFYDNKLSCEIVIPKTVKEIGESAFSANPNIKKITVDKDNPIYKVVSGCLIDTKNKVLNIGIGNAVIPNDGIVERIGKCAFYNNDKFTALNLPKSVKKIGNEAFYGCINLKTITVDSENTEYKSVNNCLISKDGNLEVVCVNSVLPQEGITKKVYGENFL